MLHIKTTRVLEKLILAFNNFFFKIRKVFQGKIFYDLLFLIIKTFNIITL